MVPLQPANNSLDFQSSSACDLLQRYMQASICTSIASTELHCAKFNVFLTNIVPKDCTALLSVFVTHFNVTFAHKQSLELP